jgi:serine/threonine protein kinase
MSAPVTNDEFLELVRKSGLVDQERLETFFRLRPNPPGVPTKAQKLAALLVRKGFLTYFQAAQLLQGKWRGFTMGKYNVLERISSGSSSGIFLAEHLTTHRLEAIRLLPFVKGLDPPALARLYQEAQANALDYPNIVRAREMDCGGPVYFLVLDFVDGSSLEQIVRKHGPLAIPRAADYIRQAAMGLQYLHQAGRVHRDIEPENILVDRQGTVTILDLGLTRFLQDQKHLLTKECADRHILGTVEYLAPEQTMNSHEVDIRVDIYGLGATFYFLLTGHPPFEDEPAVAEPVFQLVREPVPVRDLRPEVPQELVAVVGKMLATDPAQRYPTPEAVVEALAPWTQTPIPVPAEDEMPRLSPVARQRGVLEGNGRPSTSVPRRGPPPPAPQETPEPARPPEAPDDSTDFELRPQVSDDEEAETAQEPPEPTPTPSRQPPDRSAATPQRRPDRPLAPSPQRRPIWIAMAAVAAVILVGLGVFGLVKLGSGKPADPARLEGYLDTVDEEAIFGWAWNASEPDSPVQVDVYDGLTLLATVPADQERDDLMAMQKGNGKHAFSYPTPVGLKDGRLHVIRVRINGSKYQLRHSPAKCTLRAR